MAKLLTEAYRSTRERVLSLARYLPEDEEDDPALWANHAGQIIETIINIDYNNIQIFSQFADDESARLEFQLIGILVPFLNEVSPSRRGYAAHEWIYLADEMAFDESMKRASRHKKKGSSNK